MRKVFFSLLVLLCMAGCSVETRIESKPSVPEPPPRLIISENQNNGWYPIHIIKDNETGQEYLWISGSSSTVCPMVKSEVKAEKTP
jgi:uncharacterized protein YceK